MSSAVLGNQRKLEKPAIVHPLRLENEQIREKPTIVHPFHTILRFQDENAEKACIFAGFLCFHTI
ncbi:hypothetical protein BC351_03610 [Paenibacillus ferrarius]|uniref:Uncharacterized protein n=1 Tax=Paenibacillus ferrarius TaxID=1469647 RepID=A0A1V4HKF0_9BACL|nr:hypothetical protein BC351_03610 [Paenibacillus ferrarius]